MDAQAVIEFLGDVPVLQSLPSSSIRRIAQHVFIKTYSMLNFVTRHQLNNIFPNMIEWMLYFEDSGEHVFQEGENEGGIYFILEGEVEVSRS
ncbi:acyl-CoA thioesterase, RmlC-like jelly roll fold, HotDog domain protein, partial [Tanacetum coccineum]